MTLNSTSTWTNLSGQGSNVATIPKFGRGTAVEQFQSTKEAKNEGDAIEKNVQV